MSPLVGAYPLNSSVVFLNILRTGSEIREQIFVHFELVLRLVQGLYLSDLTDGGVQLRLMV